MSEVTHLFAREMTCGCQLDELPALIDFIEAACVETGVKPELHFDLTLAVEEAVSNVIEHGYKGRGGDLTIQFELQDDTVTVRLRDHAKPFKPGAASRPDSEIPLEDRPLGGLGLHLMRQLMDEVRYETLPDGNLLTMIKRNAA